MGARRHAAACLATAITIAAAASAATGCGADAKTFEAKQAPPPVTVAPGASEREVINAWAEAVRTRNWKAATDLFALPAIVQNGPEKLILRAYDEVYAFNSTLPCGARLIRIDRKGRYTVGTFLLLQRRNGSCGDGAGRRASTAFRFDEDGKITEWLRVPIPPEADPPSNPNAPSV